jgi:glutathione S-transferase
VILNDHPILYSFRRCPYAMRARMALLVSGVVCELREVKLSDKPAELIALSPKGTVPVLLTPDAKVIDQSLDIMHWALAASDPENWLESADDPLIVANDGPFKFHLDRYKYPDRHQSNPLDHRTAAIGMLHVLEARLHSSANLCGPLRSFADMAIMPFVRQFANTDRAFFAGQELPKVQHWLKSHIASPLFETTMTSYQRWPAPDTEPIYFTTD